MKKRILIISDSIKRRTGYSTVAKNIIKNLVLTDKYEIGHLGFADIPIPVGFPIDYYTQVKVHNECCGCGPIIEFTSKNDPRIRFLQLKVNLDGTIPILDNKICIKGAPQPGDHYAFDSIYFVIQHFRPDIVIPINDLWGLYNINHLKNRKCYKFTPYLAIDSDCLFPILQAPETRPGLPPIDTMQTLASIDKNIVFTNWAKNVINKSCRIVTGGKELNNIIIIPHGVDTDIWKPLGEEKKIELRKKYFNIGQEVFLLGSVARNQPRKKLDAIFMTMRKFLDNGYEQKGKKLMCYFHCALEDNIGWDLKWLSAYYNLMDRVIFDKELKPGIGPDDEVMNQIINCFDVHISLTNSEGWGLPALETAAAGIPNIITAYSAPYDWGKDSLLFCKIAAYEHEPRTGFIKAIADTNHAAHQVRLLYNGKKMCEEYSKKGIELGKKLDWRNACKQWETFLDSIDISGLKPERWSDPDIIPVINPGSIGPSEQNKDLLLKYLPED